MARPNSDKEQMKVGDTLGDTMGDTVYPNMYPKSLRSLPLTTEHCRAMLVVGSSRL